ncbi:hypothetical protein [Flammeovirga sp. SJP92]|uniref:hypothetical protein n=1 Tax=Flammeovirga sp. SJP92 TaxID=1775430 RepID=UPI0012F87528|nr:hypothetical protein [Flammeovirga sp. SJP92]
MKYIEVVNANGHNSICLMKDIQKVTQNDKRYPLNHFRFTAEERAKKMGIAIELGKAYRSTSESNAHHIKLKGLLQFYALPMLQIGAGIGYNTFQNTPAEEQMVSLLGSFRVDITKTKLRPFLGFESGYGSISSNSEHEYKANVFVFNPSVGVKYRYYKNASAYLSLGHEFYKLSTNTNYFSYSINMGICF